MYRFSRFVRQLSAVAVMTVTGFAHAATFTVTNTDHSRDTTGSLSWAINQANALGDADVINFSIGTGPKTIHLQYDTIDTPVTVNGSTQPGFNGSPAITLIFDNGNHTDLTCYGNNITISDLAMLGNAYDSVLKFDGQNNTVRNCWIGVDPSFNGMPGTTGIKVGTYGSGSNCTISHCLIGNMETGIQIKDQYTGTLIQSCAVGTDFTGIQSLPISGNGIEIFNSKCTVGPIATEPGNIIANCGGDGIATDPDSFDTVMIGNRIFNCGQSAIDNGFDGPDFAFNYTGHPELLPYISSVSRTSGNINIQGTFRSDPTTQYILEFSASPAPPSGLTAQAEEIAGTTQITTDNVGEATFNVNLPDRPEIGNAWVFSGTATRQDRSFGTSELSTYVLPITRNVISQPDPSTAPGWVHSGIDSGPEYSLEPDSPDDVDVSSAPGVLQTIVRPSTSRSRIAGWNNPNLADIPPNSLSVYRGKFYIYTSNAASDPINTVPNFRIRVEAEGAVLASASYGYGATGRTAPPQEPTYGILNNPEVESRAGATLRPSSNPLKPSLYRVDLPPFNTVPGAHLGATFESYSTEDPANGTLSLTELDMFAYTIPNSPSTTITLAYLPESELASGITVTSQSLFVTTTGGAFNAENDFQPGRRQALDLPGEVAPDQLTQITTPPGNQGVLMDTAGVPENKFGIGLFNIGSSDQTKAPRLQPGTLYFGLFFVGSDLPVEPTTPGQQTLSGMQCQIQTAGGALTSRLEISGPATFFAPGSTGRQILDNNLPNVNLSTDALTTYGDALMTYYVIMQTPLDPDVRQDVGGALGPLANEPGPGVNAPSFRDISLGVNVVTQPTTLRVSDSLVVPWAPPNRTKIRIYAMVLAETPAIDDGGYGY